MQPSPYTRLYYATQIWGSRVPKSEWLGFNAWSPRWSYNLRRDQEARAGLRWLFELTLHRTKLQSANWTLHHTLARIAGKGDVLLAIVKSRLRFRLTFRTRPTRPLFGRLFCEGVGCSLRCIRSLQRSR